MSVVSPQHGAGAALAALSPISHRDDAKGVNGTKADQPNGLQNGYSGSDKHRSSHKSSSKDKHRDKDRDRDRDKDRDREKDSSKRSSGGDRDRHSDKDRKRDKDRSDRDKDRSRSDKDRDRSKRDDKEKSEKHRSSDDKNEKSSDRHKSSSGSSKDKDKDRKSHSSKDKDGKDRHRSKKDEHRSKHTSSSSKHSDGHSSSKDKSHSSNKDKQSSSSHHESPKISVKKEEIKEEIENNLSPEVKHEPALSEEEMDWNSPEPAVPEPAPVKIENDIADSEEDMPLNVRKNKRKIVESDEEDAPILPRKLPKAKKIKKEKKEPAYESDEYASPKKKKAKPNKVKKEPETPTNISPNKRKKKQEDEPEVWKWWEEEKKDDGTKWTYLEHKGPLFAPLYERIPKSVVFRYDGKEIPLSEESEEVAGFYAKMLENDYATKDVFNENFFNDWRKVMTDKEKSIIKDLRKCDFKVMHAYFMEQAEKNRNKSKDEKAALKAKNEEIQKEYGFCTIDGHKEKIGNFRIEPPGLFRGRGEHPKMGMLKKRVEPEHITINCSKDSNIPKAPSGHKWKEVRHDNSVTWLASWTENVQGQVKYVMLNPSSKLKGEKDWQKYETARKLAGCVEKIRETYREEWKAKEMRIRQRAVALYFIDKLALRAGNEKDEDQADTVGCCSLRVEHIELHKEKDGKENVVVFDFLGKDSIRYYNEVPVEKRVFKNLELFKENKKTGDDLFDRLNTQTMNEHLRELMPNLTAKVFRTFNASFTLQNQLNELTDPDSTIEEKILAYNRANRAVAVLCNHQRAVPKGHQKSMDALKEKIQAKRDQVTEAEEEVRDLTRMARKGSVKEKMNADKKKKALQRLQEQLRKLEVQETDRDENKTIALGTSKLNYLDPRISIAWCKKHGVPIEKIYNKTQRDKFRWAIDMATVDYVF